MLIASKIKICHLTSVHRATDTRIFYKECRSQVSEYEVFLIAIAEKNYTQDGVNIIALNKPGNRFLRFVFTDWVLLYKAIKINALIYHFHDPELLIAGIILRLLGKKVIYDVEEYVYEDMVSKKWVPIKPLMRMLYVMIENMAIGLRIPFILAEKSYIQIYIKKRSLKYEVIQNFVPLVDLPYSPHSYHPKSITFGLVGNLSARRGLPFILEAIYILKNKGIMVKLRCVGEVNKSVNAILNQSAFWPEICSQVEFTGYLPFPKCVLAVKDCLAGLALPENLPNHYGSYPTKMFEYMAVGLPVIASDFELYKDVINRIECGITVNPEDSNQIANAMEYLMLHPVDSLRFSNNAINGVNEFNWNTEAKRLSVFYKTLLN